MKKCKNCGNKFKQFKSTDKYCSPKCAYSNHKPISKLSNKRSSENAEYLKSRKYFLEIPENKYCPVASLIFNQTINTTEIHHKAGRIGKLLNYTPYWLAVSRMGHEWIHKNPSKAYDLGFLIHSSTV